jgi:hypothetical protein
VVFPQALGSHDMWGGRTGWVVRGVGDNIYARVRHVPLGKVVSRRSGSLFDFPPRVCRK